MYATTHNLALLLFSGLLTGVLGALLGTGGGVFLIPILVMGLGVPMHYAVATSIVSVIATSSAAAAVNVQKGTVNMPLGMTLEIATALGAISGGLTAGLLAASTLEILFAVVLIPTAIAMWRKPESAPPPAGTGLPAPGLLDAHYIDEATGEQVGYQVRQLWAGLSVSFVAGNLSGLLGIGGGVFKVPAIHLLCGVPMKAAAATSNFMIGVTAAASAFLYFGRGEIRPALTAGIVLGVLAGTVLGTGLSRYYRGSQLRRAFAVLLALVAVQMLLRGWRDFAG